MTIWTRVAKYYKKHIRLAYVFTAIAILCAAGGVVGMWAVNKYWHPPVLRFTQRDIARTVTFHTTAGSFTIELDPRVIFPAAQFTRLSTDGLYDGTRIHRIVPDLLVEMGDPLTKDVSLRHFWGEGGLSNAFKNEIHRWDSMDEGTVAFTGSGAGTYGSQFFIVTKKTPWLVGKHTVIGKVIQGMDVIHRIETSAILPTGLPVADVVISRVGINE